MLLASQELHIDAMQNAGPCAIRMLYTWTHQPCQRGNFDPPWSEGHRNTRKRPDACQDAASTERPCS